MTIEPPFARHSRTLRLIWPQWQGAGKDVVSALAPELPLKDARRGYAVGTAVLKAVLPTHDGPTVEVPVPLGDEGLEVRDGVEAREAVLRSLKAALQALDAADFDRVLTLGGECSVSVAPFAALAAKYGDDLAVVWIDSHPDVGTPSSEYGGYHAMAISTLIGRGDPEFVSALPATVSAQRVAVAGLHAWTDDDYPNLGRWGIPSFAPDQLRANSALLVDWLRSTGASRVAIHLDVDVVDSDEVVFGLGAEQGGLTSEQVRRVIDDLGAVADVVGFTIAEFVPRQVIQLRGLLSTAPLISP